MEGAASHAAGNTGTVGGQATRADSSTAVTLTGNTTLATVVVKWGGGGHAIRGLVRNVIVASSVRNVINVIIRRIVCTIGRHTL